jgi:predicted GH43/DUF377 family glycosyl hydrolase
MLTDLVKRHKGNPILTLDDAPGADAVFNPSAVKFNGKYLLLVSLSKPGAPGCGRVIHVADSDDGVSFKIRPEPFISPADKWEWSELDYDICDPRVTVIEGTHYITYPAHSPGHGVVGILGKTDDYRRFERLGIIALPSNRVPVLFPERINGYYVRLDRPFGIYPGNLWMSFAKDLLFWGLHRPLANAGNQAWNNLKIGPSGSPIKTSLGWLIIYHTVSGPKIAACAYYQSCMLLDLKDPSKIIGRPNEYFLGPREPYERYGRVNNVIFSCGHIVEPDGQLKFYYAGCDTCICLATGNVEELAAYCLKAGV